MPEIPSSLLIWRVTGGAEGFQSPRRAKTIAFLGALPLSIHQTTNSSTIYTDRSHLSIPSVKPYLPKTSEPSIEMSPCQSLVRCAKEAWIKGVKASWAQGSPAKPTGHESETRTAARGDPSVTKTRSIDSGANGSQERECTQKRRNGPNQIWKENTATQNTGKRLMQSGTQSEPKVHSGQI